MTSDETLYYGTDHQGSTVLMTNAAGEKVWSSEATPFGDAVVKKTDDYYDVDLKYTGKDLDEDTGLYYFNARWYDAETGRFISEDPARDGSAWYAYCSNNPVNYVDPTGLEWRRNPDNSDPDQEHKTDGFGEEWYWHDDSPTNQSPETENPPPSNPPPYNPPGYNPSGPGNDPGNEPQETTPSMVESHSENSSDHHSSRMQNSADVRASERAYNSWVKYARAHPNYLDEDWIPDLVKSSGMLGKLYNDNNYVCSDFVIDILQMVYGNNWVKYFPLGRKSYVVDNMNVLLRHGMLRSTPEPGWNVFYKKYSSRYENGKSKGHIGFVYYIDENTQIIVHNGRGPGVSKPQVMIYHRKNKGTPFPNFFTYDLAYDPMYIPLGRGAFF